ncbi:glycoside hydrolase family 9 protein [Flaviaesturariibacter amylovorans]|uniref:Glycoside hydrolase family 9 protein n=1 Tax=Flaviaesturariibacter amylovorans TaxID=1084520 RepID=A0ABP8HKC7_9BACT
MRQKINLLFVLLLAAAGAGAQSSWIRVNQLGYKPAAPKVAVWCSKNADSVKSFRLVDAATKKTVLSARASRAFGAWGPFAQAQRLDFSNAAKPGRYYLEGGGVRSPEFRIGGDVYAGTADFCLRYLRQQRCGFNPFLNDSCHTHDGYTVYDPNGEGRVDAVGGWHDASDYLQYATTSANATYHLLMAARDFPAVFTDTKNARGLDGANGYADVLDEARWGLDWLRKLHPDAGRMYHQVADDRDHRGFRIPKEDSFYGRGYERPVYFLTGEPQGLFQYRNRATGVSSTAAKFASAFALGNLLFRDRDRDYGIRLWEKAFSAELYSRKKRGAAQTAPGRAPYFYEEDNWADDEELASAAVAHMLMGKAYYKEYLDAALRSAAVEPVTPWLGADTARHYQWYPFVNPGHYELARALALPAVRALDVTYGEKRRALIGHYREGIRRVWDKARGNAFYRGVPAIWCSNNLTTAFAIQCYWYRTLSGDRQFEQLEAAAFDWLFGCNPWGTSMVYGLPAGGDTPTDPHSAFTHLNRYPIDGGLVDGPVYASIFNSLKGLRLSKEDAYAPFQSPQGVYHDDFGDYSTNEPTMDGTAALVYLLAAMESSPLSRPPVPRRGN